MTVETIAELEGTIELRVIEPIYSSKTSIRSLRVTCMAERQFLMRAASRSIGTQSRPLVKRAIMLDESGGLEVQVDIVELSDGITNYYAIDPQFCFNGREPRIKIYTCY
jgi:hypothetical protein